MGKRIVIALAATPRGSDTAPGPPNDFTCSAEVNSACAKGLPAADRLSAPKGAARIAAQIPTGLKKRGAISWVNVS